MEAQVEYDATGNFRIRIDHVYGEWVGYNGIAKLVYNHTLYIAVSQYHDGDSLFPVETVMEVDPVPTKECVHV
jgi:hypothetical protein